MCNLIRTGSLCAFILAAAAGPASAAGPQIVVVNEYTAIPDQAAFQAYAAQVPPAVAKYGAKYIVRGGKTIALGADAPVAVIILEFPDKAAFQAYVESAEGKRLGQLRRSVTVGRTYMVEGGTPE